MTFYDQIPAIHSIEDIVDAKHYYDVPTDWYIAATDVRGSTQAVADGRYKEVNAVAAASITALLNLLSDEDLPFVFGGDGASILIPPHILDAARTALSATREMAQAQFDLELRVGIVPVLHVHLAGYKIRVARLEVSENFSQAIFTGNGLSHAETLLKQNEAYRIEAIDQAVADFSGFECRWNAIPSRYDETISLMVMATNDDAVYTDVLKIIRDIYGNAEDRHPIIPSNMQLAMNPEKLSIEARIRHNTRDWRRLLKMLQGSIKAIIAMRFNILGWGEYKSIFLRATDHEKFDDTLRMTISGTQQQREDLDTFLDKLYQQGKIVYGIHPSKRALVTCIIFNHFGRQVHFVDGEDGGYTLAARQMKKQIAQLETAKV